MSYLIERPVTSGFLTHRSLSKDSPQNQHLVEEIRDILGDKENLFEEPLPEIYTLEELLHYLTNLIIRFDTDPCMYQLPDYKVLVAIIVKALIHLYKGHTEDCIIKSWEETVSNDTVPSSLLVKDTLDALQAACTYTAGDGIKIENNVISAEPEIPADFAWWQHEFANYGSRVLLIRSHKGIDFNNFFIESLRQDLALENSIYIARMTVSSSNNEKIAFSKRGGHLKLINTTTSTSIFDDDIRGVDLKLFDIQANNSYSVEYSWDPNDFQDELHPRNFKIYRQIKNLFPNLRLEKTYILYSDPICKTKLDSTWKYKLFKKEEVKCLRHWLKVVPKNDKNNLRQSWRTYPEYIPYSSILGIMTENAKNPIYPFYIRGSRPRLTWCEQNPNRKERLDCTKRETFKWFINPNERPVDGTLYGSITNLNIHYILSHSGDDYWNVVGAYSPVPDRFSAYADVIILNYRKRRPHGRRPYIKSTGVQLKIKYNKANEITNVGRNILYIKSNILPFHLQY